MSVWTFGFVLIFPGLDLELYDGIQFCFPHVLELFFFIGVVFDVSSTLSVVVAF